MFIRTVLFATVFMGATCVASAEPMGFKQLAPATSEAPHVQTIAATSTDVFVSPLASTAVICKSSQGAVKNIYIVSVENGQCGGIAGDHAQCVSQETMSKATASCATGCKSTSGTGKCLAY